MAGTHADGFLINGRYRLLRQIGHGTTSTVHAAWDTALAREVAVKVVTSDPGAQDEVALRFDHEIRITARLQHPGIAAVYEAGEDQRGHRCYLMTMARGRTLEERLGDLAKAGGDHWLMMPLTDRLTLFLKLLEVIAYAHSQGVVHRDLKPANLIIGNYGELWVLDWGLSRDLRASDDREKEIEVAYDEMFDAATARTGRQDAATVIMPGGATGEIEPATAPISTRSPRTPPPTPTPAPSPRASSERLRPVGTQRHSQRMTVRSTHLGQVLGTPAYMPPEQAHGRASVVDRRADIYSLGAMLFELLTLHTPLEMVADEALPHFLERVRRGERRQMLELWPEAPQQLNTICEMALARNPQDRYPEVEIFAGEVRNLLVTLSASFAELERQRLEREREAAWISCGRWDYQASPEPGALAPASLAVMGEQVGQVHHPELGGMLLGGYGMQLYPLAIEAGDDVRITAEIEVIKGHEFWVLTRASDERNGYHFRLGAYEGRWRTLLRLDGCQFFEAELLSMRPQRGATGSTSRLHRPHRTHRLVVETVGSRLSFKVDDEEPLTVNDLQPLSVNRGRHVWLATWKSQVVVRRLAVERRRSPLLLPGHAVGLELLRHQLVPAAIAVFERFIAEHPGSDTATEARFMRCLALSLGGDRAAAGEALRDFLTEHLDHPLAQDAIFNLARLRLDADQRDYRRAVRELLAWQESGDVVRTRFCLWLLPRMLWGVRDQGITPELESGLELLRQLMKGSPDQDPLLATAGQLLSQHTRSWLNRLVDADDQAGVDRCRAALRRLRALGYPISLRDPRLAADYQALVRHLQAVDDPAETVICIGRGEERGAALVDYVRDALALAHLGCARLLADSLAGDEEPTPVELLLRCGLRRRAGDQAGAQADLEACFRLTDVLETERTSLVVLFAARLGCFGLGFLPWSLVDEGLHTIAEDALWLPLTALAAWTCETQGHPATARELYQRLCERGTGYASIGRQGLERLGPPG